MKRTTGAIPRPPLDRRGGRRTTSATDQTQLDPLLEPFAIKQLTLRNRVVSTSHEPAYRVDGLPTERYIAYHVEKAR